MFERHYKMRDYDMEARDEQLRGLHRQLFLAKQRNDKHNVAALERQIYRCGSSCYPIRLHTVGRRTKRK
jgi:hypothetical protein